MLLTDESPNTTEDLRIYESAILDVAATEMMDLKVKLDLAQSEIADDVLNVLLDHPQMNDPQGLLRRRTGVSDVVVTAPMKKWHALHTLEVVYRDTFNNQFNDRYLAKSEEYRTLAKVSRDRTYSLGIGLSANPIPQAKAPIFTVASSATSATVYYVQVSWVSANGQEGSPSEQTTYEAAAGNSPVVQMVNPPPNASGFNVYVGLEPDTLTLQNPVPIPVGGTYVIAGKPSTDGRAPGDGQTPDQYIVGGPVMRRG